MASRMSIGADFPGAVGANAPIGKGSVGACTHRKNWWIYYLLGIFFHLILSGFYPRDAMLERVFAFATATYNPSFRPSGRHEPEPVLYQNEEI